MDLQRFLTPPALSPPGGTPPYTWGWLPGGIGPVPGEGNIGSNITGKLPRGWNSLLNILYRTLPNTSPREPIGRKVQPSRVGKRRVY
jgi:hypothetical protein